MKSILNYLAYFAISVMLSIVAFTLTFVFLEHGISMEDQSRMSTISRSIARGVLFVSLVYLYFVRNLVKARGGGGGGGGSMGG